MQHKPAILGFVALDECEAQHLVASARRKEHTNGNAALHAVDHLLVVVLVAPVFDRSTLRRVLEHPRAVLKVERRNIGVGAALGIVHRKGEGLLTWMLNASATRPKDARIARYRKEFGINRQSKGILRAIGISAMRKLVPQAATLLLAQEPLPSLDIFGRHKAASAVETRPSNQRNTRSDAVHKEPPERTVPHIIADPEQYATKRFQQTATKKGPLQSRRPL